MTPPGNETRGTAPLILETDMTVIKNNPASATFVAIAKEVKGHGSRMTRLVQPLVKLNITPDDIKGTGKYYADLKDAVARAYLTPKQYAIYSNKELSQAEGTERGKHVRNVGSSTSKVRDAILKAMANPAGKRGARGKNKTPTEAFFESMVKYVDRFSKEDASDKFDFDPKLARQRLVALVKELK